MYIGAKIDDRAKEDIKDYSHLEVLGSAQEPKWLTKKQALKLLEESRNQKSTSSCGASAEELILSKKYKTKLEPAFIYAFRKNFPDPGMYHFDVGDISKDKGACKFLNITKTEESYIAYNPTLEQIAEAKNYTIDDYIILTDNKFNIDTIAYITNNLKTPVHLFVYWNGKEWSTNYPKANTFLDIYKAQYHHYVAIWAGYKEKGKKYLLVQDTAHFGGKDVRHVQEDWIANRSYTGMYEVKLETKPSKPKPTNFEFTRDLKYGDEGEDVRMLQTYLQQLGFMPKKVSGETLIPTVYFRGITRQAVKDFQKKYEKSILWPLGLKLPTGIFGVSTRKKLNKLIK